MSDHILNEALENRVNGATFMGRIKMWFENLMRFELLIDEIAHKYGWQNCKLSRPSAFGFTLVVTAGILRLELHYDAATDNVWGLVTDTETGEETLTTPEGLLGY